MTEDDLRALILEKLHARGDAWRALLRDLATEHPELDGRAVEMGLLSAARAMDDAVRRAGAPTDEARTARRLAALLAMDIERAGDAPTLGQLMRRWRSGDDFFLKL